MREAIDDDAQGPYINRLIVRLLFKDLGRHVVLRADNRPEDLVALLGQPKVGQLDVQRVSGLDEDVLGLDVPVGDGIRQPVQITQRVRALTQDFEGLL